MFRPHIDHGYDLADNFIQQHDQHCWRFLPGKQGDAASWDRMFEINVKTALNTSRAAVPNMTEHGGRIIYVSAGAGIKAGMGMGAYSSSKSGSSRLTKASRRAQGQSHQLNVVAPSIIDTPQNQKDMPTADFSSWLQPGSIATLMHFLASDEASAVTGAIIPLTNRC